MRIACFVTDRERERNPRASTNSAKYVLCIVMLLCSLLFSDAVKEVVEFVLTKLLSKCQNQL